MHNLATLLRTAQFYAHNSHNLTTGITFFEDHEFFGELYGTYEEAYDGVVERMIGLGKNPDLAAITKAAAGVVAEYGKHKSTEDCYDSVLELEKEICKACEKDMSGASEGTKNFLQGIADQSEMRQYKIQQRLKN